MDLYALLGITRAASGDEIARAYRRLARRYHPGLNPGDRTAEDLFRQVQDAFAVLSDLERRRDYDRGAAPTGGAQTTTVSVALEGFDFSAPVDASQAATFAELFSDVFQRAAREATTPSRGGDVDLTLRINFRDAVLGGSFPISIVRQDRCGTCGGDGRVARAPVVCPDCNGEGTRRWVRGHMVFAQPCEPCESSGRVSAQPCRTCAGAGIQPRSEVVTVTVPAGAEHGDRVAVPGRGHSGARGGQSGDVYVTVDVEPHAFFTRNGRDLQLTLPLAVHEAALGARINVPTLGSPVSLKIPPGTASGRRLRIRGRGVPAAAGLTADAAGDLIVLIQIVLPPVRDERSKQLLKEFGRLNPQNVRDHMFPPGAPGAADEE